MTKETFNLLTKGNKVVTIKPIQLSYGKYIPKGTTGILYDNHPDIHSRMVVFKNFGTQFIRYDEVDKVHK